MERMIRSFMQGKWATQHALKQGKATTTLACEVVQKSAPKCWGLWKLLLPAVYCHVTLTIDCPVAIAFYNIAPRLPLHVSC